MLWPPSRSKPCLVDPRTRSLGGHRRHPSLFVFDAGYDLVKLQQGIEGSPCQLLVRLRAGRCFYADPSLAENSPRRGPPTPEGRDATARR
jgi:hypothetical protein